MSDRDLLLKFLEWYDPEARHSDRYPDAVDDFLEGL